MLGMIRCLDDDRAKQFSMNFSDPFGRLSARREAEYQALQQHMHAHQIDSREKVIAMQKSSQKNLLAMMLAVALMGVIVGLLWPALMGLAIVLAALLVLALLVTLVKGNQLTVRYLHQHHPL